jgi:hypothetical protein
MREEQKALSKLAKELRDLEDRAKTDPAGICGDQPRPDLCRAGHAGVAVAGEAATGREACVMAQIVAKRNPRLQHRDTPRRDRGKLWLRLAKLVDMRPLHLVACGRKDFL